MELGGLWGPVDVKVSSFSFLCEVCRAPFHYYHFVITKTGTRAWEASVNSRQLIKESEMSSFNALSPLAFHKNRSLSCDSSRSLVLKNSCSLEIIGNCGSASLLFSRTGHLESITEVIQVNEIIATVCLQLPGSLLHMELIVSSYWTFRLDRLILLSSEIL